MGGMGRRLVLAALVVVLLGAAAVLLWPGATGVASVDVEPAARSAAGDPGVAAPAATDGPDAARRDLGATWTLCGRVLDQRTRAALASARVALADRGAVPPPTAVDAAGRVTLAVAPPPPQRVLVRAPGFVPQRVSVATAPSATTPLDLGDVFLRSGCRATVKVARGGGTPAAAQVWLLHGGEGWPVEPPRDLGRTAADGTLSLDDGLPATPVDGTCCLLAMGDAGSAVAEVVLPEDSSERLFALTLLPDPTVRVRVIDGAGAGVAGVEVSAVPLDAVLREVRLPPPVLAAWRGVTDADGMVQVRAVATLGEWGITAHSDTVQNTGQGGLVLAPGSLTEVTLQVRRSRLVRLTGTIVDEHGAVIPPANVHAGVPAGSPTWLGPRFTIERARVPESGEVRLTVFARGYAPQIRLVRVAADETEHHEEFVLRPAEPLVGVVVDAAGAPVAQAQVCLAGETRPTDAAGRFRFDVGPETEWLVAVAAPRGFVAPAPLAGRGARTDLRLVLHADPDPGARLEITLRRDGQPIAETPSRSWLRREGGGPEQYRTLTTAPGLLTADAVPAGTWTVGCVVGGAPAGDTSADPIATAPCTVTRTLVVAPGQPLVRAALELPSGTGTIVGQLEIVGRPSLAPALVRVVLTPASGVQVQDGPFPVPSTQGGAVVRPQRQSTFRIAGVAADQPLQLTLVEDVNVPWFASSTVTVPRGGVAHVTLHAQAGGRVRFSTRGPCPAGLVRFLAQEPGAWCSPQRHLSGAGGPLFLELPCRAGSHRWLLSIESQQAPRCLLLEVPVAFTVTAGTTTVVEIPTGK